MQKKINIAINAHKNLHDPCFLIKNKNAFIKQFQILHTHSMHQLIIIYYNTFNRFFMTLYFPGPRYSPQHDVIHACRRPETSSCITSAHERHSHTDTSQMHDNVSDGLKEPELVRSTSWARAKLG